MYLIMILLLCYLIGNLSPSYLLVKYIKKTDIREFGSGNAGATNVGRILGMKAAIGVFILDVIKGVAAVMIGRWLGGELGGIMGALGVVLGHNFPIMLGLRGGKGVATTTGVVLALSPVLFFIIIGIFLLTVVITRFVSVGSMVMGLFLPFVLFLSQRHSPEVILGIVLCALILFRHRENIQRLLSGTEARVNLKTFTVDTSPGT